MLKNGSDVPGVAAGHSDQESVADYLSGYINSETGKIQLAPNQVIYAAEVTHSDPDHEGYDMQDTILLVTLTPVETVAE